ncbi:hypothetical protein [Cohnella thailandensis]|uniref:Uncharacterized protein n=1 Tax=Cohnella thailandensis TaxID=557557 RepID=A0A841T6L9_9BACL|nr:hypothetical protein [Cohnella thailandensis]MBB6637710.1 hypothetical protein [Cohnella thailandensis]MBP1974113.1 hypothetical protein [Cohnella thailandensis]
MSTIHTLRRSFLLSVLSMALLLAMTSPIAHAETKPLTSAPPIEIMPFVNYTGYTYLQSSELQFTVSSSKLTVVDAITQTKSTVSELGAIVTLQRYTGSSWVDASTATTLSTTNNSYYSGSTSFTVTAGYYYRVKSIHYAKQGSVTESVTEYSDTVLVG